MRVGCLLFDSEASIEQQNALLGPSHQVAVVRNLEVWYAVLQLFVHVPEAGRDGHTHSHTEAHPMSLVGAVVGVLTEDNHLHLRDGIILPK